MSKRPVFVLARDWRSRLRTHGPWLALVVTLVFVAAVRVRLLSMPLERDEGEYAYAGQLLLQGVPPYQLVYSMKWPGTFLVYAVFLALFGQTPAGIHFGLMLVNLASIGLVFWLGRKLLDAVAGAAAAAAFGVLALSPWVMGLAGHATHFLVGFALLGIACIWRGLETGRNRWMLAGGAAFGLAVLMKQHGVFFALFGLLLLGLAPRRALRQPWRQRARAAAWFLAGGVLPLALTALWLAGAGVFERFVYWTVDYARDYVSVIPWSRAVSQLRAALRDVVMANAPLWILAGGALLLLWWDERLTGRRWFLPALLACSVAAVVPGLYFRGHYFIQMLPALALLVGAAVSRAFHLLRHERSVELLLTLPVLGLFGGGMIYAFILHSDPWLAMAPADVARFYQRQLFPESLEVARYLRERTAPTARIAVIGSEPQVYFYAQRRSVTGYIYMYPLMEPGARARRMQEEFAREIEAGQPAYVVEVRVPESWLQRPDSDGWIFDWWTRHRLAHYDLVGAVEATSVDAARVLWDGAVAGFTPTGRHYWLIFKRRADS